VAKGATESRDKVKTEAKFIRRRIAVGLIALALIAWAFDATTPEQCKVPIEQMNSLMVVGIRAQGQLHRVINKKNEKIRFLEGEISRLRRSKVESR